VLVPQRGRPQEVRCGHSEHLAAAHPERAHQSVRQFGGFGGRGAVHRDAQPRRAAARVDPLGQLADESFRGDGANLHASILPFPGRSLLRSGSSPKPGTQVREIGWGLTCPERGCGEPPQKLQELDTKVVDGTQCTGPDSPFDHDRELCMDNHGGKASACYGDSGGPAMVADGHGFALVGATSRGQTANCPEKPGNYTNVVAHRLDQAGDRLGGVLLTRHPSGVGPPNTRRAHTAPPRAASVHNGLPVVPRGSPVCSVGRLPVPARSRARHRGATGPVTGRFSGGAG
jgi:hypothetical protein